MRSNDLAHLGATLAKALVLPILVCSLIACQKSVQAPDVVPSEKLELPPGAESAAAAIDQRSLVESISRLASDEFGGRKPASPGDEEARAYLVEVLESLGLEPGGPDGQWQQSFDIVGVTAKVPETWTFAGGDGDLTLEYWDEFVALSGVQREKAEIDGAEVVFVGYGIQAPEYDWDDYKETDLEGKVALLLNNDPDWDPALFEGKRRLYYGRWDYKYERAARRGAAGAIIIHTTPSAGYPWQVVQQFPGEVFGLPAGDKPRVQVEAWVTEEAARSLVAVAGHDLDQLVESAHRRDFVPVPLGLRTSLALTNTLNQTRTANVLGLLPGSDLQHEVVVFTAHHDHLGIGEPDDSGDTIYNGALDNASGCGQVLAIARAFTELPRAPRRSVLFLFVAGEEDGFLGSDYYVRAPTFPLGAIAANINVDGANIWGRTADVTSIGYGKSSLDRVVEAAAARQMRTVKGDQFPDRGSFYRSDQFSFVRVGVPAIYLGFGVEFIGRPDGWGREQIEAWEATHYHQPSDELDEDWNFEGMIEDARLVFEIGLSVADADQMPRWNPGDEFEAARQEALAALDKSD